MFVFAHTVAFKAPNNLLFRRLHFVSSVSVKDGHYWITKRSGAISLVPVAGTTLICGRKVKVAV